jgi:hypothetical protein
MDTFMAAFEFGLGFGLALLALAGAAACGGVALLRWFAR